MMEAIRLPQHRYNFADEIIRLKWEEIEEDKELIWFREKIGQGSAGVVWLAQDLEERKVLPAAERRRDNERTLIFTKSE